MFRRKPDGGCRRFRPLHVTQQRVTLPGGQTHAEKAAPCLTSFAPSSSCEPAAALVSRELFMLFSRVDQGIAKLLHSGRGELSECPCAGVSGNARSSVAAAFARVFAVASGPFRLQGIPASYLIFLEKIGSAKRFTPNSRGSEKECFAFSGGYPADAGCSRAGEIRLVKSTSWRIAGEIVSSGDCIRKILNGDPQWWLFRFGSLRRHRNSEKAGTFAAFSLALRS
jgi:hypothetical protein